MFDAHREMNASHCKSIKDGKEEKVPAFFTLFHENAEKLSVVR
jgi:hypothetical protein